MSQKDFIQMLRDNYKKMMLSKKETAKEFNVSEATLDRLRSSGDIQSMKIGGSVMFSIDEIARFLVEA